MGLRPSRLTIPDCLSDTMLRRWLGKGSTAVDNRREAIEVTEEVSVDFRTAIEAQPPSAQCAVALDRYKWAQVWVNLFTALIWVLAASTVIFLIMLLWFIYQTVNAASRDAVELGLKIAADVVAAGGALITGKAAAWVSGRRDAAVADRETSKTWVNDFCTNNPSALAESENDALAQPFW